MGILWLIIRRKLVSTNCTPGPELNRTRPHIHKTTPYYSAHKTWHWFESLQQWAVPWWWSAIVLRLFICCCFFPNLQYVVLNRTGQPQYEPALNTLACWSPPAFCSRSTVSRTFYFQCPWNVRGYWALVFICSKFCHFITHVFDCWRLMCKT